MKSFILAAAILFGANSFAQPHDIGTCKAITPELFAIPGDITNLNIYQKTSLWADSIKLSQKLVNHDVILEAVFSYTNASSVVVTKTVEGKLGSEIGHTYSSYHYVASNKADSIQSVRMELELLNDQSPADGLFSVLVQGKGLDRNSKVVNVTLSTRYMCKIKFN